MFTIGVAGKKVNIYPVHEFACEYCKDYLVSEVPDEAADLVVRVNEAEILAEQSAEENISFSEGYLETLAIYRKMAEGFIEQNILLMHGSVVSVDGEAYLFAAKSGTGKSTHTALWREYFGDRAVMVNDDKPLLAVGEQGVIAYGTPWNGKHQLSNPIGVKLRAVCFLERAEVNSIREISRRDCLPLLMRYTYRPKDGEKMSRTLALLDQISRQVRSYQLNCNMDLSAAKVAYEGMKQEKTE